MAYHCIVRTDIYSFLLYARIRVPQITPLHHRGRLDHHSLTVLARIELIWNPLGIRFEVFDNRPSFETIADVAGERPVIFGGSYAIASKYNFYTGKTAYCQPDFFYRTSQWQFRDDDTKAAGKDVLWGIPIKEKLPTPEGMNAVSLANGQKFIYTEISDFKPVRLVDIYYNEELVPEKWREEIRFLVSSA